MASVAKNPFLDNVLRLMEDFVPKSRKTTDTIIKTGPAMWTAGILDYLVKNCVPPGGGKGVNKMYPKCILPMKQLEKSGQEIVFREDERLWRGVILPVISLPFSC
jgi:hypothetical protein